MVNSSFQITLEVLPSLNLESVYQIPKKSRIAISCSHDNLEKTLDLANRLQKLGYFVIPHLSARLIVDEQNLKEILNHPALTKNEEVFVIGGDLQKALGKYDSSLKLLEAMAEQDKLFSTIGVAGYPQGHPFLEESKLFSALLSKQQFAKDHNFKMYLTTQICFDVKRIVEWIKILRQKGITLPVEIGILNPLPVNLLKKYVNKLHIPWNGDFNLDEFFADLNSYPLKELGVIGFRFYTFNELLTPKKWWE